ncbi:MAG: DUF348 domain-containing protein [Firmicutes bacterium]|nr:DUF348 domain-containing protein [Bacillota bacterium]
MKTMPVRKSKPFLNLLPAKKSFLDLGRTVAGLCRKQPLVIFYGCLIILAAFVYRYAQHSVFVYVDGEELCSAATFSRTVEEFLNEKGIQLHPCDRVSPHRGTVLTQQTRIDVQKAFEVAVIDGNNLSLILTPTIPVEELLAEEGFELGPDDRIEPGDLYEAYDGAVIRIVRVRKQYAGIRSSYPFDEIVQENPLLDRGLTWIVREGCPGLQEELVEITIEDGVEVKKEVVGSVMLEDPLDQIIEHGANTTLEREGCVMQFDRVLIMTATSYCPGTPLSGCPLDKNGHSFCTGKYNNGYTYTGKKALQGLGTLSSPRMIAVDPRVIPLGSLLYIEPIPGIGKIGFARAEDIGGAIKGHRMDLLYDYHSDVVRFGVRRGVKVYLLKE